MYIQSRNMDSDQSRIDHTTQVRWRNKRTVLIRLICLTIHDTYTQRTYIVSIYVFLQNICPKRIYKRAYIKEANKIYMYLFYCHEEIFDVYILRKKKYILIFYIKSKKSDTYTPIVCLSETEHDTNKNS